MPSLLKKSHVDKLYLFLNTSSRDTAEFCITNKTSLLARKKRLSRQGHFDLFFSLMAALKRLKRSPKDIARIFVVQGPGMFSHLRSGISIAQCWHYVFLVPVEVLRTDQFPLTDSERLRLIARRHNKMSKKMPLPLYGAEPNITIKKNRV